MRPGVGAGWKDQQLPEANLVEGGEAQELGLECGDLLKVLRKRRARILEAVDCQEAEVVDAQDGPKVDQEVEPPAESSD